MKKRRSSCGTLSGLRRLWMNFCSLTDAHLVGIENLQNLKVLDIGENQISAEGIERLASLPLLETLYFQGSELGKETMDAIANLASLKTLDISNGGIEDEQSSFAVFSKHPRLESLTAKPHVLGGYGVPSVLFTPQSEGALSRRQ